MTTRPHPRRLRLPRPHHLTTRTQRGRRHDDAPSPFLLSLPPTSQRSVPNALPRRRDDNGDSGRRTLSLSLSPADNPFAYKRERECRKCVHVRICMRAVMVVVLDPSSSSSPLPSPFPPRTSPLRLSDVCYRSCILSCHHPRPCPRSVAQAPPTQTRRRRNTCVIVRAVPSPNPPSSSSSSTRPCPYPRALAPPHSNSATVQYVRDCTHCTVIEPLVVIVLVVLALVSPLSSPSLRRTSPLRLSDGATRA